VKLSRACRYSKPRNAVPQSPLAKPVSASKFHVIVVHTLDDFAVVHSFIFRVHDDESPETRTQNRTNISRAARAIVSLRPSDIPFVEFENLSIALISCAAFDSCSNIEETDVNHLKSRQSH
jgi:hypothetical protein